MQKHKAILKQSTKTDKTSNTSREVTKWRSVCCVLRNHVCVRLAEAKPQSLPCNVFEVFRSFFPVIRRVNRRISTKIPFLSRFCLAFPGGFSRLPLPQAFSSQMSHRMKKPWEVWWRLILLISWLSLTPFAPFVPFVSFFAAFRSLSNQALSFTFHLCIQFIQFIQFILPSPSRFQEFKAIKRNEVCFVCFVKFSKISALSDSKTLCRDGLGIWRMSCPPMLKPCVKLCRSGGGSGRQRLFAAFFCTESSLQSRCAEKHEHNLHSPHPDVPFDTRNERALCTQTILKAGML